MEPSYPGNWAGSVVETNYFLRLYATFHPVYRDEIWHWLICLLENLKNQSRNPSTHVHFNIFHPGKRASPGPARLVSVYMGIYSSRLPRSRQIDVKSRLLGWLASHIDSPLVASMFFDITRC